MKKTNTKTGAAPKPYKGLIGLWFHSVGSDGVVCWQGQIIARPEPGVYLVQLYEWFTGSESVQQLVPFADMKDWLFYSDSEGMKLSWECGTARPGSSYNPRMDARRSGEPKGNP